METIALDLTRRLLSQFADAPAVVAAIVFLVLVISGTAGRLALRVGTTSPRRSTS